EDVPQDDDATLLGREGAQCPRQLVAEGDLRGVVVGLPDRQVLVAGDVREPGAAPRVGAQVDEHLARVRARVAVPRLVPAPVDPFERALHEVLGQGTVAREKVRRPEEVGPLRLHEGDELLVPRRAGHVYLDPICHSSLHACVHAPKPGKVETVPLTASGERRKPPLPRAVRGPGRPWTMIWVELGGLEPPTPCMPCRCATSCATAPRWSPPAVRPGERR